MYSIDMNNILIEQTKAFVDDTTYPISNICNVMALIFQEMEQLNWVGIYYYDKEKETCYLGPFQGKTACTPIPIKKGVVGTCADTRQTIVVSNTHEFPGHIACDSASLSEIVIPIVKDNELKAILDIDSPILSRFSNEEKETLEAIVELLVPLF